MLHVHLQPCPRQAPAHVLCVTLGSQPVSQNFIQTGPYTAVRSLCPDPISMQCVRPSSRVSCRSPLLAEWYSFPCLDKPCYLATHLSWKWRSFLVWAIVNKAAVCILYKSCGCVHFSRLTPASGSAGSFGRDFLLPVKMLDYM